MLDNRKIASYISEMRRQGGLTQQQVADRLGVSFQAVSKWETGTAFPGVDLLLDLSRILGITADELLLGQNAPESGLTYGRAGVDISYTDRIKQEMAGCLQSTDPRVLSRAGQFAALFDFQFQDIREPVLVLKAEEPGSKQKMAFKYGYSESICHDMVNHLVNDIAVMGAKPLAVLDTIVCGSAEKDTIKSIVKGIADACQANECSLVGGETSIQPGVVESGVYILTACIAGVVGKSSIIDGSSIASGDVVLAIASNGLHTNGYSLVRMMMETMPHIVKEKIDGLDFLDAVMKPHTPYFKALKGIQKHPGTIGMAHITGGGIAGNLARIIPTGMCARIDLSRIRSLGIFRYIKANGNVADDEMLATFNCGVGMIVVVKRAHSESIRHHLAGFHDCYEIGEIVPSSTNEPHDISVELVGKINWGF